MAKTAVGIDRRDWLLLVLLSVLWGGSFFFAGVAVRELPPLTIVFARVALAAVLLTPLMWVRGVRFPSGLAGWWRFFVMAVLNNVIPFSLIVTGQTMIASGLALLIPVTAILLGHFVLGEALKGREIAGALVIGGALVLMDGRVFDLWARPNPARRQ
jgi:drug/metabolite transporter (DMT)-like permease